MDTIQHDNFLKSPTEMQCGGLLNIVINTFELQVEETKCKMRETYKETATSALTSEPAISMPLLTHLFPLCFSLH